MSKEKIASLTDNDCFIIMPIADCDGYNKGHFRNVYEDIIKISCNKAGFNPIRADEVKQTNLIHLDILKKLIDSPMAICDLSSRNPNVLFELGLRQAFDKPTVLIQEIGTPKIFDISPLRYTEYRNGLNYREVLEDQEAICEAIIATKIAREKGEGVNSIISLLSLSNPASLREMKDSDASKMLQVVMSEMNQLRADFRTTINHLGPRNPPQAVAVESKSDEVHFEYNRCRLDFTKFSDLIENGAPHEYVERAYNRLQTRLMNLDFSLLPPHRLEYLKEMSSRSDIMYSEYSIKKK